MEKNVFDQQVKNYKTAHENIRKSATGQGEYYVTGC